MDIIPFTLCSMRHALCPFPAPLMPPLPIPSVVPCINDNPHTPQQIQRLFALGVISFPADRNDRLNDLIAQSGLFELDYILRTGKPQGPCVLSVHDGF